MALYQLDSRGAHYDDLRAGAIASVIANVNRNEKVRKEPFGALDFIPWNEHAQAANNPAPILLDDPDAQSALILSKMFPQLQ